MMSFVARVRMTTQEEVDELSREWFIAPGPSLLIRLAEEMCKVKQSESIKLNVCLEW